MATIYTRSRGDIGEIEFLPYANDSADHYDWFRIRIDEQNILLTPEDAEMIVSELSQRLAEYRALRNIDQAA